MGALVGLARSFASVSMRVVETRPMLPYSTKVITEYGFPLDLQLAGAGVVGEDSLKEWMEKKGEFIKGFDELKVLLTAPKN
jgi:predicted peptidase